MDFFNKLRGGERTAAIGAIVVVISALVSVVTGFGMAVIPLLGAIAVLAILYMQSSSAQSVAWPAPVPLILLAISGVTAVLAVVLVMPFLSVLGFLGIAMLALIALVIGSLVMIAGSWTEYQAMPKTGSSAFASGGTAGRSTSSAPATSTGTTGGTTAGTTTTTSSDYTDTTR